MKTFALIAAATLCMPAIAQMPVPLLDNNANGSAQWKAAAPLMQASLECRQRINPDAPALRTLLPKNTDQWELTPPNGFSVFGLPVQSITIYIDPTGEMGATYTAVVAAPKSSVASTAKLHKQRNTKIGILSVAAGDRPSLSAIICTVNGSRGIE